MLQTMDYYTTFQVIISKQN